MHLISLLDFRTQLHRRTGSGSIIRNSFMAGSLRFLKPILSFRRCQIDREYPCCFQASVEIDDSLERFHVFDRQARFYHTIPQRLVVSLRAQVTLWSSYINTLLTFLNIIILCKLLGSNQTLALRSTLQQSPNWQIAHQSLRTHSISEGRNSVAAHMVMYTKLYECTMRRSLLQRDSNAGNP